MSSKHKLSSKLRLIPIISFAVVLVCFALSTVSANTIYAKVTADDSLLMDFSSRPLVSIPMMLAGLAALVSVISGITVIIKYKEKSVLVWLATIISALLVLMTVAELIFQG